MLVPLPDQDSLPLNEGGPAFEAAVVGLQRTIELFSGQTIETDGARFLTLSCLAAFVNANGLSWGNRKRLQRQVTDFVAVLTAFHARQARQGEGDHG